MIALIIILAILALLFLLLLFPVRFHVRADLTSARVELVFLFFRKKLVPQTKKRKKGVQKKKKSLPKSSKAATPKRKLSFGELRLQYREIRRLIAAILLRLPDLVTMKIRRFRVTVATDDPAKTALLYGGASAGVAFFLEWLGRHVVTVKKMRGCDLTVSADFLSERFELDVDVLFSARLLSLLIFAPRVLLPFYFRGRSRKRTQKKSSAIANQSKPYHHSESEVLS
jgi:hypothetical protein